VELTPGVHDVDDVDDVGIDDFDDVDQRSVDLAPRDDQVRYRARGRHRWAVYGVLAAVLVIGGALVYKGLSEATLYFRTADEAVAQKTSLGTSRFRMEGTVVAKPVEQGETVEFNVRNKGVTVPVHHTGSPPEMFRPGIPVVLEGHWAKGGAFFASDHILVKHDEKYESEADYKKRVAQARKDGQTP
jgi:cytochrome c-type biogenesis protein CcmE